jgi:hypothetical protein
MRQIAPTPVLLVIAGVVGLGCTITTYKDPAPPPPPPPRQRGEQVERTPAQKGATIPGRRGTLSRPGGGASAPRVSSATPFGGPQPAAFRGLAYVIPDATKTMPDVSQMVPFALLHTDSFDVASQDFKTGFPGALAGQVELFAIRYEGKFTVPADGSYQFKVVSDDGAVLYVDGSKVVDNDGVHTSKTTSGQAQLKAGEHQLKLDYFQAKGPVALQVYLVSGGQERVLTGTR